MILPLPLEPFTFFIQLSVFAAFFVFAMVIHEAAHYIAIKRYGGNPRFEYHKGEAVVTGFSFMSKKKKINVYWAGVIAGLFGLYPAMWLLFPPFSIGLIVAYFAGCKHDFKELSRLIK